MNKERLQIGYLEVENRPTVNGSGVLLQGDSLSNLTNLMDPFNGNRGITRVPSVGQNFGGTTVSGFLNNMFFPFVSATLTLNSFPIQDYGTNTTSIGFNSTLIQNSEPNNTITNMQYFRGETSITSPTSPQFGNYTSPPLNLGATLNVNTTGLNIRVNVNDNGSPKTLRSNQTLFFQPRYYYGLSSLETISPANLNLFSSSVPTFKPSSATHLFAPVGQYIYFIYPNETKDDITAWGNTLSSIFDLGSNTENITNFTVQSAPFTITYGNGKTLTFRVYRSTLLLTVLAGQSFNFRFTFI